MSLRLERAVRASGLKDAIMPQKSRKILAKADAAISDQSTIEPRAAKPIRTPLVFNWIASSEERQYAARAGTAVSFVAHCDTPPSSSGCIVRLTQETSESGETVLHDLYIPSGQRMYGETVSISILAGSWLRAYVFTASGASDVSAALVVNVG